MLSDAEKKAIEILRFSKLIRGRKPENDAVEILLNLIKKQSKEIEELKQIIKENTILVKDENGDYQELNINIENYIHKDKIKAKIEEYDDKGMTINLTNRSAGKTFQQAVHYEVKNILQSLLEKE